MSFLLPCALSLALQTSDEPVPTYFPTWPVVPPSIGPRSLGEVGRLDLLEYGRFALEDPRVPFELFALRLGSTPEELELRTDRRGAPDCRIVCLERRHRVFPGESFESIAEVYQTRVGTLLALNGREAGDEPSPWSLVQVPALFRGPADSPSILLPMPDWSLFERGGEALPIAIEFETMAAQPEDTWADLAAVAHCHPRVLADVNGFDPTEPMVEPAPGAPVLLHWTLHRELGDPLVPLALFVEHAMGVPLERLLRVNEVARIEDLRRLRAVRVPFQDFGGYRAFEISGRSIEFHDPPGTRIRHLPVEARPGRNLALEVRRR